MPIKKILIIFFLLIFISENVIAGVQVEKKFQMWESQYVKVEQGKICFAVSIPTKMLPDNLNRAESRIFITFRPKDGVSNEISITNGYTFKKNSNVNVNVGNAQFKFQTKDKFAWMISLNNELKMIRAMKKANRAQVIGISSRGNKTKDTYSLIGFTKAYNSARSNCKKK